jgi:hypothetical protein
VNRKFSNHRVKFTRGATRSNRFTIVALSPAPRSLIAAAARMPQATGQGHSPIGPDDDDALAVRWEECVIASLNTIRKHAGRDQPQQQRRG